MLDHVLNSLNSKQNVIPVIGFELLSIKDKDENGVENQVPYLDYLSKYIAEKEEFKLPQNESGFGLFNHVIQKLYKENGFSKYETTYKLSGYILAIHNKVDLTYLKKIVSILPFKYFINLTFTTHLQEVIGELRSFHKAQIKSSSFPFAIKTPRRPDDLIKSDCSFEAVVYHLFGQAYSTDIVPQLRFDYYYSDDDMLEFIPEFNKRFEIDLKNYNEIVRDSSLLFLGCQYPDWLIRILINTLKPGSLKVNDQLQSRIFFDYCKDDSNSFFLEKHRFRFQKNIDSNTLVCDLYNLLVQNDYAIDVKSNKFVFISYTRANSELVQKIVCQLSASMNIWFDKIKLFPGDLINDDIKEAITNCGLFIPIVTNESINKHPEDYIRQEWTFYQDKFKAAPKVIPLVYSDVNTGVLGFNPDTTFATAGANLYFVKINNEGISDQDIEQIKDRL